MKTIFSRITALLLFFFLIGCASDTLVPCVPITCKNGGVSTSNCGCTCPQGYTGSDCSFQVTPTKITITKITVTAFSNYTNSSFNWDATLPTAANALPDIYFKIVNSVGGDFYVSPTYFKNAMSDGTRTFDFVPTTPLEITNPLSIYTFQLYDYDSADSNLNDGVDDLMASKVFSAYSMSGGFPTTLTITDSSIPLSFKLTLSYTW
jgi:hypothetical protein